MSEIWTPSQSMLGWKSDPQHVGNIIAERTSRGDAVMGSIFAERNAQELPGTWARMKARGVKGVFLRDREIDVYGEYLRPHLQEDGTCVSRAMFRGVQTSLVVTIADRHGMLKPVLISFAPIYTLARHECGHDRCGNGAGAIMADAAKAVHDYGVATVEDICPGMDEVSVERQAVKYAAPGVGTPSNWIGACAGHTCVTFWPETLELLFDCLAAGYAVPYAHSYVTGSPNSKGISDLGSHGPHARCFVGVFVDENGETQLESSESWGCFPARQPSQADRTDPISKLPCVKLRFAGGERLLAPGDVGVNAKRFWQQIQSGGEAWAVGAPLFKPAGVADLLTKKGSVV